MGDDLVAALAEDQRDFELERAQLHNSLEANVQRAFSQFLDQSQHSLAPRTDFSIPHQSTIDGGMISDASDDVKNSVSSGASSCPLIPLGHTANLRPEEAQIGRHRPIISTQRSIPSVISEPIIEIEPQDNLIGRRKNSVIQPNPVIMKNRLVNGGSFSGNEALPEPVLNHTLTMGNQLALNRVINQQPTHLLSHGHHVHSHHHHHHHHHVKLTPESAHAHVRARPLTPPPVYRCPQCPKLFESPHDFWLHLRVDHFNALFQLSKLQMGNPPMGTPLSTSPMPTNSPTSSFSSLSHQMH